MLLNKDGSFTLDGLPEIYDKIFGKTEDIDENQLKKAIIDLLKEHQANPPYEGAVFNETSHRWEVPDKDKEKIGVAKHIASLLSFKNSIPKEHLDLIKDVIIDEKFGDKLGSYKTGGKIFLKPDYTARIFAHEIGHAVFANIPEKDKQRIIDAMVETHLFTQINNSSLAEKYGYDPRRMANETFSEYYARYAVGLSTFKSTPKEITSLFGKNAEREEFKPSIKVPPEWHDVKYSTEPNAKILVTAKDSKNRTVYIRSKEYNAKNEAEKFARLKEFSQKYPQIIKQIDKDRNTKEEAVILSIIANTGLRIGSDKDTKAKVKAYGVSTLEGRHVKIQKDQTELDFIGKEGIRNHSIIHSAELGNIIKKYKKEDDERLFSVSDSKVRDYLHNISRDDFKPKDFRTFVATDTALKEVKQLPTPKSLSEFQKLRKVVAKKVSDILCNTPDMALKSYIAPEVFTPWENNLQLAGIMKKSEDSRINTSSLDDLFSQVFYDSTGDWRDILEDDEYEEEIIDKEELKKSITELLELRKASQGTKVYLYGDEKAPEGSQVITGPKGGKYYISRNKPHMHREEVKETTRNDKENYKHPFSSIQSQIDDSINKIYGISEEYGIEVASFLDATGKSVLVKRGYENSIDFDGDDMLKMEKTSIHEHTHPNGTSFSESDIVLGILSKSKLMIVTGKEYTYYLDFNNNYIPSSQAETLFWVIGRKLFPKYEQFVGDKDKERSAAIDFSYEIMKEMSDKCKWNYFRVPREVIKKALETMMKEETQNNKKPVVFTLDDTMAGKDFGIQEFIEMAKEKKQEINKSEENDEYIDIIEPRSGMHHRRKKEGLIGRLADAELQKGKDEKTDFFYTRTAKHINLVRKYLDKIIDLYDDRLDAFDLAEEAAIHDKLKYEEPELIPYIKLTWDYHLKDMNAHQNLSDKDREEIRQATLHHITNSKHHPEYWDKDADIENVPKYNRDEPTAKIVDATKMPDTYVASMVADWLAMSEELGTSVYDWVKRNINIRWKFTDEQIKLIYDLLDVLSGDLKKSLLDFQKAEGGRRVYIHPGDKVPEGKQILTGKLQGKYYIVDSKELIIEDEKEKDTKGSIEEDSNDIIVSRIKVLEKDFIDKYKDAKEENGLFIMENGQTFKKIGNKKRINIGDDEKDLIKNSHYFIHNHPYPGGALSWKDLRFAIKFNIKKFVAFDDNFVYSISSKTTWEGMDYEKISKEYSRGIKKARNEFQKYVYEFPKQLHHIGYAVFQISCRQSLKDVAKKYDFIYEEEKRND